ncbi:Foie gras liver health family 1-domain-containing protein [Pisolithus orientalis]|uniref:Foie gras liver health family 1-domain-containing protein n=1 Tax=Pisolithus orientalis TaxID=936130 RepID=UPI0022259D71|nr:Foie gras liver health family 1-domain-containing protein [Pisolithus orientalis]KAI6007599.1 Foie gras liver health family 1-domain-containing protein [Pisolithus orientalis]
MNSYPAEMLMQLAPVMFVSGLDLPPTSAAVLVAPSPADKDPSSPPTPPPKVQDPFTSLISRLREVLLSQSKSTVWSPERTKIFQVVLVDKFVGFPPRKSVPPDDPSYANAHSPLSPLTPSSPVFPDGLIAPIWIKKHMTYLPSVFVLFLRMYEVPHTTARSPLGQPDSDLERERAEEERRRDIDLSAEIAQRKKSTGERGIKLTVVLIASRRMLDDPSLDGRLSFIRRQSSLDSRAALFVLSPVSPSELNDFVSSLQDALYESAIEYYTSHSKRVRRKRNRHSQTVSSYNPPPATSVGAIAPRPLRPEGWTVRYEYKMAAFAEFRGEDEVALKHYQDAYTTLMIMFGSTAILPPRTKRWAEAKVLADTINVKITKFYLYNHEYALALSHCNSHMRRFADFSRGWGIGEETFEYWSWMARQYRVLAELLEQGARSTLTFPIHILGTRTPGSAPGALGPGGAPLELDAGRMMGLNPNHALQHPGHYYYMAARCTEARRERFLANEGLTTAPGYANEKKVDHLALALELYTKAYELFKQHSSTASQGRLTLWIAYRIALTYYESGKFGMAVRFFERITKTYRREKWNTLLRPLYTTWYACTQKLGDVELSVKLLVEMIACGDVDEPGSLQEDLLTILRSSVPSSADDVLTVDLIECEPICAPANNDISNLPVDSITIMFSDDYKPITLRHSASEPLEPVRMICVSQVHLANADGQPLEVAANLRWRASDRVIVSGTILSATPITLSVSSLVVTLKESGWTIKINHDVCTTREGTIIPPYWLSSLNPVQFIPVRRDDRSNVVFRHRPHRLSVSFSHQQQALLDEEFPITVEIVNRDDRHLDVVVDILLQPAEVDEAVQFIVHNGQRSSGLIKGAEYGTAANRTIDVSVQSNAAGSTLPTVHRPTDLSMSSSISSLAASDTNEFLQTLVIPATAPFSVTHDVEYQISLRPPRPLSELSTLVGESWNGGEVIIMTKFECVAPCSLEIEGLELKRQQPSEKYLTGDQFCNICWDAVPGPGKYIVTWRRIISPGERGPSSTTRQSLPLLLPPKDGLVGFMTIPSTAKLHVPIQMHLVIRNHNTTRSAIVTVALDQSTVESFVVAGLHGGRLPTILPGAEEKVTWNLIPVECGMVRVPRVRVMDYQTALSANDDGLSVSVDEGVPVQVIDTRFGARIGDGNATGQMNQTDKIFVFP